MVDTDYYEKLVEKYFIDNTHKVVFTLLPKKGMAAENDAKLADKLNEYKESLSEDDIAAIKAKAKRLEEFHEMEESEENLNKIPTLELSDIKKEAEKQVIEEKEFAGEKLLYSDITTNGIAYMNVSFNAKNIDEELIPYLGLYKYILGNVDTNKHTYTELSNIINMNSGGINNEISSFTKSDSESDYSIYFETNIKIMYDKFDVAFDIIRELLLDTKYEDEKRIKEVIAEAKGMMESAIVGRGHVKAMLRAMGRFSESSYYADKLSGIDFYLFLKDLYKNYDSKKDEILSSLRKVSNQLFLKKNMLIHLTCEQEGYELFSKKLDSFYNGFYDGDTISKSRSFVPKFTSEGIGTSQTIQFVARCGEYISQGYKYNGHFTVLSNILDYGYLWENIRDKGGAYGCMYKATRTGKITLSSYRDPKLRETNDVYEGLPEYLRSFDAKERDMVRYIIGAISNIDAPKTPRAKGSSAYNAYMSKISYEDIQQHRDELLATTAEDIRDLAKSFETALANSAICVIGNRAKIEENKDMFANTIDLFE
jgi:Zn-dependent M16 (insulinase) family peptidase